MKLAWLGICLVSKSIKKSHRHCRLSPTTKSPHAVIALSMTTECWEVEQKFAIPDATNDDDDVEERLKRAGMVRTSRTDMVDWYFDVPSKNYPLLRQDCWLRFRGKTNDDSTMIVGQWELKRGGDRPNETTTTTTSSSNSSSKVTVYQEIEGKDALYESQKIIAKFHERQSHNAPNRDTPDDDALSMYQNYSIPVPPVEIPGLTPLARIATQRSSWKATSVSLPLKNLVVDLDSTDFGHSVGEVETVVDDPNQMEQAKNALQNWLIEFLGKEALKGPPPMGKLEYYLSTQRPEILEILVEAGLLPSRS